MKKSEISNENCSGNKKFQWRNEKEKKRNRDQGRDLVLHDICSQKFSFYDKNVIVEPSLFCAPPHKILFFIEIIGEIQKNQN